MRKMGKARVAGLMLAAGAVGTLSGCERADDKLAVQIDKASHAMSVSAGSGRALAPVEQRSQTYQKVVSDLGNAIDGASEDNQAVARVLMARAKMGQASINAGEFVKELAALTNQITLVRSGEARLRSQLAVSESLAGFDPRETLSMIDARAKELDAELAGAQSGLDELQAMQSQVQAKQEAEDSGARAEREFEQALRDRAMREEGQLRLDLVSQAVSHERSAAQHEKRSAEIGLDLATVTRAVEDRAREVATLERMRQVQEDTRARIAASQSGWSAQRQAALDDAKASAEAVSQALATAKLLLNDRTMPSYEAATSAFDQAIGEARKAQSALRQPAAMVMGSAQHALADVHGAMGEAMASLADVLESLGGLSNVSVSGLDAKAIREQATTALDASRQTLDAAASSFRSAGGRLSELGELIDRSGAEDASVAPSDEEMSPDEDHWDADASDDAPADEAADDEEALTEEEPG